jgi:hypothetical protein
MAPRARPAGGGLGQSAAGIWPDLGGFEPSCAGDAPDVLAAEAGQAHEVGLTDAGFKGLDDRGVELVACAAELLVGAMLCGDGLADAAAWLSWHAHMLPLKLAT